MILLILLILLFLINRVKKFDGYKLKGSVIKMN